LVETIETKPVCRAFFEAAVSCEKRPASIDDPNEISAALMRPEINPDGVSEFHAGHPNV